MALVNTLSVKIERLTREEVRSHSQTLVDTFLVMLDYRTCKQGVSIYYNVIYMYHGCDVM